MGALLSEGVFNAMVVSSANAQGGIADDMLLFSSGSREGWATSWKSIFNWLRLEVESCIILWIMEIQKWWHNVNFTVDAGSPCPVPRVKRISGPAMPVED